MREVILIIDVVLNGEVRDILIENGLFKKIAPSIEPPLNVDEIIEGRGRTILPSFYNNHTHIPMSLMKGYADDIPLHSWLTDHIWPFEKQFTGQDFYVGSKLAMLEMIKSGTTYFCDMYLGTDHIYRATEEMGLRATIASAYFDFDNSEIAAKNQKGIESIMERYSGCSEKIEIAVGPHAVYTVGDSGLDWIGKFSKSNNIRVTMHLSETEKELNDSIARSGLTPVELLDRYGVLNDNLIAAHVLWVNSREIEILADRGVNVVHCPASNMKLASGSFKYQEIEDAGVKFSIGTDGSCSNNNLSMLDEMRIASLRAKEYYCNTEVAPAAEVFRKGSVDAASCAGVNGGVIEEGRCADAIIVDTSHLLLTPTHDLISNMVNSADSSVIDYTICGGRVLMRERVVDGEQQILSEARECVDNLIKRVADNKKIG